MAIFIDSQQKHYIGILYVRDDGIYSGKFVMPSNRAVQRLDKFLMPTTYLLGALLGLCLVVFAIELTIGPPEFFNYFFAATAWAGVVVAIPYLGIGPLILSRTRRELRNVKLRCLHDLSRRMYVLPLVDSLLVASSIAFMPVFSPAKDAFFYLLFFGPIFIGLTFAVVNYSRRGN